MVWVMYGMVMYCMGHLYCESGGTEARDSQAGDIWRTAKAYSIFLAVQISFLILVYVQKSGNKEFGVKGSSTPEPAQLNFNECSMPPTPGTPSTPTTPALPAMPMSPTSAAVSKILPSSVPESPKSSPR